MNLHLHRHLTRRRAGAIALALIISAVQGCAAQADLAPEATDSSPQVSAASSVALPAPADVPPEFQYVWIGDNRSVPALSDDERLSSIFMFGAPPDASAPDPAQLSFFDQLPSRVIELSAERMTLVSTDDGAACRAGDTGTYVWSLSPAGDELRLELIEDACATRAAALPGTWTRSDCPLVPDDFCLGDLEPGTHRSSFFDPFAPLDGWEYRRGALTYAVPAGWANTGDYPDEYLIQPQDRSSDVGIYMWSEVAIVAADAPCNVEPDAGIARTPEAFASWLTAHPGLLATEPVAVTIGGLNGLMLDASVRDDAELPCVGHGRYLPMLVHSTASGLQWGFAPVNFKRFYLLDLADGRSLVISIEAEDEASFGELLPDATAIVESMTFSR